MLSRQVLMSVKREMVSLEHKMATSSFDKKFVVKDPVVVVKVLKELEMVDEEKVLTGDGEALKGEDQGLDYLGIISHTEKI